MARKYDDTETFEDQEIDFHHEGKDYLWRGDYDLRTWGELADDDYPGDSDSEVKNITTETFEVYNEDTDTWEAVKLDSDWLEILTCKIEKAL